MKMRSNRTKKTRIKTLWRGVINAAKHNDQEAVRHWVEVEDKSVTSRNVKKQTAAHFAAANDNLDMLKYLLQHDRSTNTEKSLLKIKDVNGFTLLHTAVEKGSLNVIRYLVDEIKTYTDIFESVDEHPKNTVLHIAAENGQLEVLKYLVEEKKGDVNVRNKLEEPPIFLATEEQHLPVVKYLVAECKANLTITDWNNNNILHCAAYKGDLSVPKYLLDEMHVRIDVNARNDYGDTVIRRAATFNHLYFIKYFVGEKHADVNIPDIMSRTPLYQAAYLSYLDLVKYLVEHGADTEIKDDYDLTPLQAAVGEDVKKYLKKFSEKRIRRSLSQLSNNLALIRGTQIGNIIGEQVANYREHCGQTIINSFQFQGFLMLAIACVAYFMRSRYKGNTCVPNGLLPKTILKSRKIDADFHVIGAASQFQKLSEQ